MILSDLTKDDSQKAALLHQQVFFKGWTAADFLELLKEPLIHGRKITANGALGGYILWREIGHEAEVLTLVVAPSFQKQGLGTLLLNNLISHLVQKEVTHLFIEVAEDNGPGRTFYEKNNFIYLGERQNYYQRKGDKFVSALNFSKKLL